MTSWLDDYVETNGIRIHYHRTGSTKPQIILLHGITDNGLCWTPIAKTLESTYDVIMLDARGHGLSDGPETGFSLASLAADVGGLIEALGLERPYILGHSLGATTAATVAARYPERVRAILLEDPPWHDGAVSAEPDEKFQTAEHNSWLQWLLPARAQTHDERIAEARKSSHWSDEELEPWADAKEQFKLSVVQRNLDAALKVASWREVVAQIRCPLLLITGDPDRGAIVTPQVAQEVTEIWHDSQVVHIPGAGHNIRREQYKPYIAAITNFLQQH